MLPSYEEVRKEGGKHRDNDELAQVPQVGMVSALGS